METEKDRQDRHHLLNSNHTRIEQAYLRAKNQEGMTEPVILVVDTRDKLGEAIVAAHVGQSAARAFTEKVDGAVPTVILAAELKGAKQALALTAPKAKETLSRPIPPGTFWVVVVANGGNTYAALPAPK